MIRLILLITEYICFFKAIEFATHPSKNPTVMGLYSNEKFLAISGLILSGIILHKIKSYTLENKDLPLFKYPIQIGFTIIITSYVFQLNTNLIIGVDFAEQFKSLLQWTNGTTATWNTIKLLDINDLSKSNETWLFRPPGAMIYYVPFVYLNISLGESLRIAQLILCFVVLYSWFKIGYIFKLNSNKQLILCICISLWLSTLLSFIGNVQLLVTAYSSLLTLTAVKYTLGINNNNPFYNQLKLLCISFLLGASVLLKLSGLIYNGAILLFCLLFITYKGFNLNDKILVYKNLISFVFASLLFIAPFIFLNFINSSNGVNVDNVYRQDYNNNPFYQLHWGRYFTETTNFPAVILSSLSSWSTFSPINSIQTLISNAVTYLGFFNNPIYAVELNPKVIYKATIGILLSIPIFHLLKNQTIRFDLKSFFLAIVLTIPFVIFTIIAYRHGYNYLITGTYNQQYLPFFTLFFLVLITNDNKTQPRLSSSVLIFASIVFFTFSNTQKLFSNIRNNFSSKDIANQNISNSFYGNQINKVSEVVNSNRKDITTPIIFFANTSIAEISVLFKGNIGGIAGASEWSKNSSSKLNTLNKRTIIIFDSRLSSSEINSIFKCIKYKKSKTILDLNKTAKVYLLN